MSDVSSLTSQLPDNLSQLVQLEELLAADPANEELLALRDDLRQVIQMTVELQRDAGQQPSEEAIRVLAAPPSAPAAAAAAAAASAAPSYAAADSSASAAASVPTSFAPHPSPASLGLPVNGVWPVGSRVMALYAKDGKHYVARVDRADAGAEEYQVTYLEYNQPATVAFDAVRPWVHATPEQLKVQNTPVKAMYPEDGLFYNASLDGPSGSTPGYYVIKFGHLGTKKKKKVEVPLQDICINERFMNAATMQFTPLASAAAKGQTQLTEEMTVPEHLVVQPTDSEAVRTQKIKKLKKLRFEHRKAWEEQEQNKRKTSWQDFKSGKSIAGPAAKKQKLTHALPGLAQLQKPSMFSTSDSVEAVVGVTNSGQGMTQHLPTRKHLFAAEPNKP